MSTELDDFMATMVTPAHPVAAERAVALVRERYGIEASPTRLSGERDENFRLRAPHGAEYVLKIANPAENAAVSELPAAALQHIERVDPDFPCPRVIRDRENHARVHFIDQNGLARTACLLTYLPGKLLGHSDRSVRQRTACGHVAGRLTRALGGFTHPAAHRAVVWDVRHTSYVQRLLGQLPDLPCRTEAAALLMRIVPEIDARLPRQRAQVVHNDMNPLNILVEPADETRVSGVIDFGDITHTALIADLAVAAAELIPGTCRDAVEACESIRDVARAYDESVPLQAQELAMLGTLVAARLVMNVVVHEWHVHHNRANDHHAPLAADYIATRLAIAACLPPEDFQL
jgi:hydroxylysine kinase